MPTVSLTRLTHFCRDHFAYVNELPNGQIVQYQQAGTISYFFVGDDVYAKPLGGEYKWHSKKTRALNTLMI